ncbi:MAG TPA: mechanosensitive ion channel family protein [Bacteroidota bacterium]|nr:mechanosensitive ion channel family protein [Bacteroidota bacterium]
MNFWGFRLLGNSVEDWLYASGTAAVAFLVMHAALKFVTFRLGRFAGGTKTPLDDFVVDLLRRTRSLSLLAVALFLGSLSLAVPSGAARALDVALVMVVILQGALWGNAAIRFWLSRAVSATQEQDAARATTISALEFVARILLWSMAILLALENLGISVTGLVAGLGVGGIAVALALQNILGDLFASLSIVLDKPFVIGDFIVVDDHVGSVEHVGLKSTRLRSLSGEQIVCANSDLLKSRIRNFKRMYERRIVFSLGVTYQTSHAALTAIPGMIRSIVQGQPSTRFDRAHFREYGDSALLFEVVYFVTDPDYNRYMDIQQAINLEIYRQFADAGIEFAYPTRTVVVQYAPEEP